MSIESFCDVMALLRKQPRRVRELVDITGLNDQTIRQYLEALRAEGHAEFTLKPRRTGGIPVRVYRWLEPIHGVSVASNHAPT